MELLNIMENLTIEPMHPTLNVNETEQEGLTGTTRITQFINGVPTKIVLFDYTENKLLMVTQYQKFGSMIMIQKDQVLGPMGTIDIYSSKVMHGSTEPEIQIAARYLAEVVDSIKPLCVMIDLKSYDMETVNACKKLILGYRNKPKHSGD